MKNTYTHHKDHIGCLRKSTIFPTQIIPKTSCSPQPKSVETDDDVPWNVHVVSPDFDFYFYSYFVFELAETWPTSLVLRVLVLKPAAVCLQDSLPG